MDVVAAEDVTLAPGARHAVATGFAIAIPVGFEVQVRPRSGLALKHGVTCLNTPGTIDADYRGEVKVILANLGGEPFRSEEHTSELQSLMRISYAVFCLKKQNHIHYSKIAAH